MIRPDCAGKIFSPQLALGGGPSSTRLKLSRIPVEGKSCAPVLGDALLEGLSDALGETLALGDTEAEGELLGLTLGDGEILGETDDEGDSLADGLIEGDSLLDGLRLLLGLRLGLSEGDGLSEAEGERDGDSEADGDTEAEGETEALGDNEGETELDGEPAATPAWLSNSIIPATFAALVVVQLADGVEPPASNTCSQMEIPKPSERSV